MTLTFFWCKFGFGTCFGASSPSNHWAGHHWLSYKIHFSSLVTIWSRNGSLLLHRIREEDTSEWWFLKFFGQLFHLSNLFQMPNDHRMVDVEFFGNFLCSCKRISFNNGSQLLLSASNGQPLCSSSSKLLSPWQNFLNHHCTVCSLAVPGPTALLIFWVVSVALWPILNSNKKIAWICFLSNIISLV